jgi:hypothetical protein
MDELFILMHSDRICHDLPRWACGSMAGAAPSDEAVEEKVHRFAWIVRCVRSGPRSKRRDWTFIAPATADPR